MNQQLEQASGKELKNILKLNEWYVLPDIPIKFQLNGEPISVTTFTGDNYPWTEFYTTDSLNAKYLHHFYKIKPNDPNVILNGLMVPEPYSIPCNYLKFTPYISIQSYQNEVRLNLERSRVESGLVEIVGVLRKKLIYLGLKEFQTDAETIVDKQLLIKRFHYDNDYFKSIPLFFCRNGFGICSYSAVKDLSCNAIVQVYGYRGSSSLKLSDLKENVLYVFNADLLRKSEISDLIECNGSTYIPAKLIQAYFYDATSQYNGFRLSTMKRLYDVFYKEKPRCETAYEFWQHHNQQKANLFKNFFSTSEHVVVGDGFKQLNDHIKALFSSCIVTINYNTTKQITNRFLPRYFIADDIEFQFINRNP